ncbi:unnamed protein product, partial [Onchocerca ochengi]|uniref:DDE-1 domain-containing protein n=1 Tax=Onchocerca ochengi TaxID=42157 RepID=A0A182ERN0_ONCOC
MQKSKQEEPIARRTRSAIRNRVPETTSVNATTKEECKWISGVSFSVPDKWNCDEIPEQNFTSTMVAVYTQLTSRRYRALYYSKWKVCNWQQHRSVGRKGSNLKMLIQKDWNLRSQRYGNHITIDELQTSFVFKDENATSTIANCEFLDPYIKNDDIIIDMKVGSSTSNWTRRAIDQETSSNPTRGGQIIMMETNPQEVTDPENAKFQYTVYSLQQEFNQWL